MKKAMMIKLIDKFMQPSHIPEKLLYAYNFEKEYSFLKTPGKSNSRSASP